MEHFLHGSAYIRPLCTILCVTGDPILNKDKDVGVVYLLLFNSCVDNNVRLWECIINCCT